MAFTAASALRRTPESSGGAPDTKSCRTAFTRWLVEVMEERLPEFDQELRMHVTGCSNSCGQHWIADIGMEGKKIKHEGVMTDAYYFCLGGGVGDPGVLPGKLGVGEVHAVPIFLGDAISTRIQTKRREMSLRTLVVVRPCRRYWIVPSRPFTLVVGSQYKALMLKVPAVGTEPRAEALKLLRY